MSKIKITFIETNCKKNGPIKQTLYIIKYLDRNRFEPSLITIWDEDVNNTMLDEYIKLGVKTYCTHLDKKSSMLFGKNEVRKVLNVINPHIIQGVGMPPYRFSLGYKEAVHLVTLRNYCYEDYPDQYGKYIGTLIAELDMRFIKKRFRKGFPFLVCSSSLNRMYSEKQGLEIPFIQNGVDVSKYTKRDYENIRGIRDKLNIQSDKIVFVYSGGLIDRKNQRECIEGFLKSKRRNEIVLLLLGDGIDKEELEKQYGMHENILFAGNVSNVEEYLHASDIYISTSKSEGLPNGVLEAMACGVPVLLSDIPQHLEILEIDSQCGESYSLGDINQLSKKIDSILERDLVSMGNVAYNVVMENFTAERMSQKYQNVYRRIADNEYHKTNSI